MKASSISELKKELNELPAKQLVELCLHLAKYKKDNKEFLDYLLFQAHDKSSFVSAVKNEIDEHFNELKTQANLYYVKKSLRKLLRIITKYCKYISDKALAAELHIYFCQKMKDSGIPYHKSQLLVNMYEQQIKKINTLINGLHEDLQQDYLNDLEKIL
jgi:membrane-anchored protein YejM (alkaline phosphatase superfamily)